MAPSIRGIREAPRTHLVAARYARVERILRNIDSLEPTNPFQLTHLIGDAPFKLAIPGGKIDELISDCSSYEPPDSRGN
jgi:hypothetical protein